MTAEKPVLKRALSAVHLWAIAVGLVISGEYFGWNYGWGVAGTIGFLIATLLVTVLYITFIFSFTELTTSIPQAGGPFAYSLRAFGPIGGIIAGYATVVELVLATPAIAFALGSYLHFLYPACPVLYTAIACYIVFTAINLFGVKESAVFSLVVTILAVGELLVFMGIVAPHFQLENFTNHAFPISATGVFAALPFAIWFYLGIEGTAMLAEEARDPMRTIPRGYILGIATLVLLALGVMLVTGGAGDWRTFTRLDYPLPQAIATVMGKDSSLTKLFTGLGLFGLIASFHGIITSYGRQIFALGRSGFLPAALGAVQPRFQTPHRALIAGSVVGMLALLSGTVDKLIILSALGAVVMYIISMASLLQLRRREPHTLRPFRTPFYPWFPCIALVLSVLCLLAIIYTSPLLSAIFFAGLVLTIGIFRLLGRHTMDLQEEWAPET